MPDCLGLVRYRTIPGIVSFFLPVPDYSDARQSGIPAFIHMNTHEHTHEHAHKQAHEHALAHTHRPMMNRREHGQEHGRAAWTGSIDMDMDHGHGGVQAPQMPECR
jgi:ABC-type nickel/cobalt efflux system permease component RcnA